MSGGTGTRRGADSAPWTITSALAGGTLVCVGAALPWMSFFAGLRSLSGLVGLYGRVLFASGALAALAGAAMLLRRDRWLQPALGVLGLLQLLFVVWLLFGLRSTTRALGMHAMLLARPGPGLYVALLGALLVAAVPSLAVGPRGGWNVDGTRARKRDDARVAGHG